MRWCGCEDRSMGGVSGRPAPPARRALPLAEHAVFANQQVEVRALLRGELEEDPLAFRVFEPFAVAPEEAMRSTFAADADEQRLLIVHARAQLLGAFGKQPVGGALEEEERRPPFEIGIFRQQLLIAFLQRAEVFLLLAG